MIFHPTAALVIRIILGILFVLTGILKLPNLKGFYLTVVKYNLLKGKLAKLFAYTLPFAEIIIGIFLLINILPTIISLLALLILIISLFINVL